MDNSGYLNSVDIEGIQYAIDHYDPVNYPENPYYLFYDWALW